MIQFKLLFAVLLLWTTATTAALPDGLKYDAGYTWFSVESKRDTQDGKPIDLGFHFVPEYRIWGEIPKRSAFRTVVSQDGEQLADIRCESEIIRDFTYGSAAPAIAARTANWCAAARAQLLKTEGFVDVAVYYIDGNSGKEYLARQHKVDIRKVERVRGLANKPEYDTPIYYVARHGETAAAFMQLRAFRTHVYGGKQIHGLSDKNHVLLYFSTSPADDIGRYVFDTDYLRCSVNGEGISLGNFDAVHTNEWRKTDAIHVDRDTDEYKKANPYKEQIRFKSYVLHMPLTFGDEHAYQGYVNMKDHPGEWVCRWESQGNLLREFSWSVNDEGRIEPHPEESGDLYFAPDTHMISMRHAEDGSPIDARLVTEAAMGGGFYGHQWTSSEMQAAAAAVPAKGSPWPVRSSQDRESETERQRQVYAGAAHMGGGSAGIIHWIATLLMCAGLFALGAHYGFGKLPEQVVPFVGKIGLALVALALFDFLLDLLVLRPFVADILVQLTALIVGFYAARANGELPYQQLAVADPYVEQLKGIQPMLGFVALAVAAFHLLLGWLPLF